MNLVAIVGPTSVGKSSLSLHLSKVFRGEIINADSRQVYRHLDIGTAKPSKEDRSTIPHHLLDLVDPDQEFSLALYRAAALKTIQNVQHRGNLPFLVGGSGLYVWSMIEGWEPPPVPPNHELRAQLQSQAEKQGYRALYERLLEVAPQAARQIDPRNVRRVIRALEVCYSGIPLSHLQGKREVPFKSIIIGLTAKREELYCRIDARVDAMIGQGLVGEVRELIKRGYHLALPSMSGIGYKQMGMHLEEKLALPLAIQQMKFETHRFARHQYAWFRLKDERIHWIEAGEETNRLAEEWLIGHLN